MTTIPVVFIAGHGRSGSTLLERLLGQAAGICSLGELKYFWDYDLTEFERCACGCPVVTCPFWSQVLDRAFADQKGPDMARIRSLRGAVDRVRYIPNLIFSRPGSRFDRHMQWYAQATVLTYQAALQVSGARIIVDSSKDISTLIFLSRLPQIRLLCLHLVRDSRAVAFAWTKQKRRPDIADREVFMHTYAPSRSALEWNFRNLAAELAQPLCGKYLKVRYEDLAGRPEETLRMIFRWIEPDRETPAFLGNGPVAVSGETHQVSGNPARVQPDGVAIAVDDAWQEHFSGPDRLLVTTLTWPGLLRYGYLGRPVHGGRG